MSAFYTTSQHYAATGDVVPPIPLGNSHLAGSPSGASPSSGGKHSKHPAHGRKPRRRRAAIIALIVAAVLLLAVYIGGVVIFSHIYYPGTMIAGADVSLVDAGSAAARIRSAMNHYSLTIEGSDFTWKFQPENTDALFDADDAASTVLGQNESFIWPVRLVQSLTARHAAQAAPDAVDLSAEPDFSLFSDTFDEAAFEESLGSAIDEYNEGRSGTFDAASAFDEESGAFTVEKARSNEKLDRDNVIAYAKLELASLAETAPLDALGDDAFLPLIEGMGNSDIQATCDAANGLLGVNVTIMLGDTEAGTVGSAEVAQWIVFDESLTPSIDQDAVAKKASEIAKGFNTVGTERTYTREDGKKITVSGGTFGWKVDDEQLAQDIISAVNEKKTGTIEAMVSQSGDVYNGQGERDWGAYVDIDITEQHARYYDADGNLLWESGVITGNPTRGNDTPTGVYYLRSKARDIVLRGPKDPETNEYKWESKVSYWMPFIGSSIGLHDATWQASSSFSNPNAYKTVGSHGCVNLPQDKAQELYDMLEVDTCVIVHK